MTNVTILYYNNAMELPIRCSACGRESMVDLENLERVELPKLCEAQGFTCRHCGKWQVAFFSNRQLDEKLRLLNNLRPNHRSFRYHFAKTLKRAEDLQRRGFEAYGTS